MKFNHGCILVLLMSILASCTVNEKQEVKVSERKMLVNDALYTIKGICYHPVPKGSANKRDFGSLKEDILLMKEAGINTIRVYAPIEEKWVLDEFALNDIKVIIGFGYDQDGYYDMVSGSFID